MRADGIISPRFDDSYVAIFKNAFAGKMSLDAMILAINAGFLRPQVFINSNNDFPTKLKLKGEYPSKGGFEIWAKERRSIFEQIEGWKREFPVSDKHPSLPALYSRNPSDLCDDKVFSHSVLERCKSDKIEKFKAKLKMLINSREAGVYYGDDGKINASIGYHPPLITAPTAAFAQGYQC